MKVLFVTPYPVDCGSTRFRVVQFVPYLESRGIDCTVSSFTDADLWELLHVPGHVAFKVRAVAKGSARRLRDLVNASEFDTVVIQREAYPFGPPVVEQLFARLAPRVLIDFDDAVHLKSDHKPKQNRVLYRLKYARDFDRVLKCSDGVIAGNEYLAEYARHFNPKVTIIPTVMDLARYPEKQRIRNGPVVIGFRGSHSTTKHLLLLRTTFARLWERFGQKVRFVVHGDPQFEPMVPNMVAKPFSLGRDMEDLLEFDIGLMPLEDNPWTRGKCGAKALEYGAIGVPVVSSPVGVATDIVEHGVTGFLANGDQEWTEYLRILIEDEDLRYRLGANLRKRVADRYSVEYALPRLEAVLRNQPVSQRKITHAAAT